jgi:hypothetical protein
MKNKKGHRTEDVITRIALPMLILIQAYLFYKKFVDMHTSDETQDLPTSFKLAVILSIISIIMSIIMIDLVSKIYRSKNMTIFGYHRDRDEFDFRRRKRNMVKVLFALQIITLVIITVLKI